MDLPFDSRFLQQVEQLMLAARRTAPGLGAGRRRSPTIGSAIEFADYRTYTPGDDVRRIDWNVYARLDKLFLRMSMVEENTAVTLFIDRSRSMAYGLPSKSVLARRLAAALAYAALVNDDRVAVAACGDSLDRWLPPVVGRAALGRVWRFLQEQSFDGPTDLGQALASYRRFTRGPGLAIVLSDLLTPSDWRAGLTALRALRQDVVLIQILAPDEIEPGLRGDLTLVDDETGVRREVSLTAQVLKAYRARLAAYTADTAYFCAARGIPFVQIASNADLNDVVLKTLRQAGVLS